MDPKQIDNELDQLDASLTRLKRDFEIYFSGGAKLPPNNAHRKLEREIRNYARNTGLTLAQKFRYNNISARYNTYVDLWNKQLRMREEGRTPSGGVVGEKPKLTTQNRESDSTVDQFQKVFNDYIKSRNETGEGAGALNFEKFSQQLAKQKEMILAKLQCKDVEFYVTVEQKQTKLKARPIK